MRAWRARTSSGRSVWIQFDPGRGHAVPDLGPIVLAERLGLDLDAEAVELAAGRGGHVGGVDLDGVHAGFLDPGRHPEGRPPLRHQADVFAGDAADRAEHLGTRVDDDLASHPRREHLSREQGRVDILAIEVEIDPTSGELQPFLQGQDPFAGEPRGELRTGVGGADFRQGAVADASGRVGLAAELVVVEEDVMAVAGQADVNLGPLHRVRDRRLQGAGRVLGGQPRRTPMRHDLERPGGLHGLEERECPDRRDLGLRDEEQQTGEGDHGVPEAPGE